MPITAENLHEAADICASFGDDETLVERYGLTADVIQEFVLGSDWREVDYSGPYLDLDPMALAMGITIGVIAARRSEAERLDHSAQSGQ